MYEDEELTFKEFIKKKTVIVLSVLMLISLLINICKHIRTGIYVDEDIFLVKKSSTYYGGNSLEVKVDKQRKGTIYKFISGDEYRNLTLYWEDDKAIATFENGEKISGYLKDGELVNDQGTPVYYKDSFDISVNESYEESFPVAEYGMAVFATKAYKGEIERYNSPLILLFPTILFIIGLLSIYFPNKMHFWGEHWKYEEAELSELGVLGEKTGGIIFIVASFILVFFIEYIMWG